VESPDHAGGSGRTVIQTAHGQITESWCINTCPIILGGPHNHNLDH
jgi:hypothetical protein